MFFREKAFEAALGVGGLFTDDAERGAFGGFGDEPVK